MPTSHQLWQQAVPYLLRVSGIQAVTSGTSAAASQRGGCEPCDMEGWPGCPDGQWNGQAGLGVPLLPEEKPNCRQAQEGQSQEELLARPPELRSQSSRAFSPADTHLLSSGEWGKFYRVSSFQEALVLLVFGENPGKILLES